MNRRTVILSILGGGFAAGTAVQAGWWDNLKTIVGGHANDLTTRLTHEDQIISGGILGTGTIDTEADGQDPAHNSSGTIGIVSTDDGYYIQLGNDFKSSPGPDYHVYISLGPVVNNEEDFWLFKRFELGPLVSGSGASYYKVSPEVYNEIDHLQKFSVVIWCKAFGAYIGSATVKWDTERR